MAPISFLWLACASALVEMPRAVSSQAWRVPYTQPWPFLLSVALGALVNYCAAAVIKLTNSVTLKVKGGRRVSSSGGRRRKQSRTHTPLSRTHESPSTPACARPLFVSWGRPTLAGLDALPQIGHKTGTILKRAKSARHALPPPPRPAPCRPRAHAAFLAAPQVLSTARNAALVLVSAVALGEDISRLEMAGYTISLGSFALYNYFRIKNL